MVKDDRERGEDPGITADVDSAIYQVGEVEEEWTLTIFQRIIAGFLITVLYLLVGVMFWEDYKLGLGIGIILFVLTVVFGGKFLKILASILRITGPV